MKRFLLGMFAIAAAGGAVADFPDKPITIVVPFAAGGPTDRVARDFAEALRRKLGGQTVVIDNAGGCGRHDRRRQSRARQTRWLHTAAS